jgi:hypothetical protein
MGIQILVSTSAASRAFSLPPRQYMIKVTKDSGKRTKMGKGDDKKNNFRSVPLVVAVSNSVTVI